MTATERSQRLRHREDAEERRAQRLGCTFLVQGCEQALFELRAGLGHARHPHEVRVGLRAAALLEEVLATWRETLSALPPDEAGPDEKAQTLTRRSPALTTH